MIPESCIVTQEEYIWRSLNQILIKIRHKGLEEIVSVLIKLEIGTSRNGSVEDYYYHYNGK